MATRVLNISLIAAAFGQMAMEAVLRSDQCADVVIRGVSLRSASSAAICLMVVGFWIWIAVRQTETNMERLLPWFSLRCVEDAMADAIRQFFHVLDGHVPDCEGGPLVNAFHGFGLTVITMLAFDNALSAPCSPPGTLGSFAHTILNSLFLSYVAIFVLATLFSRFLPVYFARRVSRSHQLFEDARRIRSRDPALD